MKISGPKDILCLLRMVNRTPDAYCSLIICSPYISKKIFINKVATGMRLRIPTTVITRPDTAITLSPIKEKLLGSLHIKPVPNLHAKIYLAVGKYLKDSIALFGSFNLTANSLYQNFEIGIRVVGITCKSQNLINNLEKKLRSIT